MILDLTFELKRSRECSEKTIHDQAIQGAGDYTNNSSGGIDYKIGDVAIYHVAGYIRIGRECWLAELI